MQLPLSAHIFSSFDRIPIEMIVRKKEIYQIKKNNLINRCWELNEWPCNLTEVEIINEMNRIKDAYDLSQCIENEFQMEEGGGGQNEPKYVNARTQKSTKATEKKATSKQAIK